jgi:hypothetical protein
MRTRFEVVVVRHLRVTYLVDAVDEGEAEELALEDEGNNAAEVVKVKVDDQFVQAVRGMEKGEGE